MKIESAKTKKVQAYIKSLWKTLTRTHDDIYSAAIDPKHAEPLSGCWPVYISRQENLTEVKALLKHELSSKDFSRIVVKSLPRYVGRLSHHGLLYLPYPYVVPGGRFNELYGWDAYFIMLGLLHDNLLIW